MEKIKFFVYVLVGVILFTTFDVSAETYSEVYKEITTDGTLNIKSVEPKDNMELELFIVEGVKKRLNDSGKYFIYTNAPDEYIKNEDGSYNVKIFLDSKNGSTSENHDLKVYFSNEKRIESITKKVDDIKQTLNMNSYAVVDLGFVNFLYAMGENHDETDNIDLGLLYSNDLIKTIGNNNISYSVDNRMGNDLPYDTEAAGFMVIYYNDVAYGVINQVGVQLRNIMYIPNDTVDTDQAYIEAAMRRIKEYFGSNVNIKIEPYKKISDVLNTYDAYLNTGVRGDFIPDYALNDYYNGVNNKLDMTYKITVNGHSHYMLIEKDSSKMITPLFNVKDDVNDVSISTTSGNVPLDTTIFVNYIKEESEEYKRIDNAISGEFTAIDLTLYSSVKKENITKLDNGKFLVTIPVDPILNNKTITTYYLNTNNILEEHSTTVKDGYASFETDHFSTYILAEKQVVDNSSNNVSNNIDVPATLDNVTIYLLVGLISVLGLVGSGLYIKKMN